MYIFLVAVVAILCGIFGLSRSRNNSLRVVRDEGEESTIRLPAFIHRTPLIQRPQAGFEGDAGNVARPSQESLEIFSGDESMEEGNIGGDVTEEQSTRDDRHLLERRILDQKIRDANQLGIITESLWPHGPSKDSDKVKNQMDTSKPIQQKINTRTLFNLIQYETFKEAMNVLKHHQEQEEAAKIAKTNVQSVNTMENDELNPTNDKENRNS